jgi:dienelactone hydrolase
MSKRRFAVTVLLFIGPVLPCAADNFFQEELRLPVASAGPNGLQALLVRPKEPGRYPLLLLSHGSPRTASDRPTMSPSAMLPQALEFARRGFAAVVVMRRGYGGSGGGWAEDYGSCADPDYVGAGTASASDLKAAIALLSMRPDIDSSRIVSVGVSAGGFATVALASDPPPGLVAGVSFAGGRGSLKDGEVCRSDRLVEAFGTFGKTARIPMLWVYAENDHFFDPELAVKFKEVFEAGGGKVDLVTAAPFGEDGHFLFSPAGIPAWAMIVDSFFQHRGLVLREAQLTLADTQLTAPASLSPNGRREFEKYRTGSPHKAFAASPAGAIAWRSGQRSVEAATAAAVEACAEYAADCRIVFVDDVSVAKEAFPQGDLHIDAAAHSVLTK